MKDLSREVNLICPICGNDLFSYDEETDGPMTCSDCGHETNADDLILDNAEQIDAGVEEIADEAKKRIEDELFKSLKSAFGNSKNIKITRG